MKARLLSAIMTTLLLQAAAGGPVQQQARIQGFSPQGTVKRIRQVRVLFSEPMVPLGDPRVVALPFDISCPVPGTPRWADERNWIYDFDRDLQAGMRCEFRLKEGVRTLAGRDITGQRSFSFSTGGPAILRSNPDEGSEAIEEDQTFILELDGTPTEASVLEHVSLAITGIANRVGVRIVVGSERDEIVKSEYRYDKAPEHLLLLQARQKLPASTRVSLVWGRGVASTSGIATEQDQILLFVTRSPFTARFSCSRENPEAQCVPITPMGVNFSGSVAWSVASKVVLKGPGGKQWSPQKESSQDPNAFVNWVQFKGPFPELSTFTVELPPAIKDDSGRELTNADKYPLTVKTDAYPPLAKFAAPFGILELKANPPLLPVTLRNVEPVIAGRMMGVVEGQENVDPPRELEIGVNERVEAKLQGKIYSVPANTANEMLFWIKKVSNRSHEDRDKSVFGPATGARAKSFSVPKLQGAKAFEVLGIPLKAPGFYVVEIESELLGAALLGQPKPIYVPTTVLVTNLSVHFKWGGESSIVWVTTLDGAKPVAQAAVQIRDCEGKVRWEGNTGRDGIARPGGLPSAGELPRCSYDRFDNGLVISARAGDDMSLVHTSWDEGIEPWRFQLPTEWEPNREVVHTIFDRTLFRPGETVHMKHIVRRRVLAGFARLPENEIGSTLQISHQGTSQKYDLPLKWSPDGSAESSWTIPKEAKLGFYYVGFNLAAGATGGARPGRPVYLSGGSFRVEEYRVPLMKAIIRAPSADLVAPSAIPVDLTVTYLGGGGAGRLPVKFRYLVEPRYVPAPPAFDSFNFATGRVREGLVRGGSEEMQQEEYPVQSVDLALDRTGSARTNLTGLPKIDTPMGILAELDFKDPNGEVQTASSRIPLWPSSWLIGIKPDSWALSRQAVKFQVAVADLSGKPVAGAPVKVDLFQRKTYSHRKRLVGGFYAYEHTTEISRLQALCSGKTDRRGLLLCERPVTASGSLILEAVTVDGAGREAATHQEVWIAGPDDWWFATEDSDRMDVIPEAKHYEPGAKARFQVRMPFRKATALITVEREGVAETIIKELSGKEPVIELPVKGSWAPNVFISVLAVRGRISDVQPTATVDLGRPAFRLGIAEIQVGWKTHELKVSVATDRPVYKVRDKAQAKIAVATADGQPLPPGSEVAVAAVDEGLLELMPNASWNLLSELMGRRSYGVQTFTAQMNVIGKRHFGLKALPQGGGGGKAQTRELFDTLLLWKGRLKLDARGEAAIEIPLNDSLTSFRIVAVATGGVDRFGTGATSIRTTQDLILFSGIAPLVRQGDRYVSTFTVRNTTERPLQVRVSARVEPAAGVLQPQEISLGSGESKEIRWNVTAPRETESLKYELEASAEGGAGDRLSVTQKIVPAVPVRTLQATLIQIEKSFRMDVERPADAIPGMGGIRVAFQSRLLDGLSGVADYMRLYPYTCLEQIVSKAVALRDTALWGRIMGLLPVYLDSDGLAKYFPSLEFGSDELTAYVIAIADEAGWEIPQKPKERMLSGLQGFVEGRVVRYSALPTADLTIRKVAAIEALTRTNRAQPGFLSSLTIEPNLWPTSAVIDWFNILTRMPNVRDRAARLPEAQQILRARLNFQGTTMGFSTERMDMLWWLMVSVDTNAVRLLLSELNIPEWKQDVPRLVRGALGRQRRGHWDTTVANAWGVLAMEKFSKVFESTPVTGQTTASLAGRAQTVDWQTTSKGTALSFPWPEGRSALDIGTRGTGMPWATIQSLAAVPLREPLSTGFKIRRTLTPIEQKESGVWNAGDIVRVKLDIESQADMTWVVVNDPVPGGSAILGSGLGGSSRLATKGEQNTGWVWPAFEERSFEAFRAYFRFVPKGEWSVEYTIRLNNAGAFQLPPTRVEAMYAPEMFGELPNATIQVK
ncbi:MAG: alpha-2-macroglobulin [Acidobacteriia bacterium]|nr:alpha-2-macroglobulin [Terriglobia bacterium]